MPIPAPRPLDALRQHSRAVILTAAGGDLSDDLESLTHRAGIGIEVVDHPLLAVAALTEIEREAKPQERAALVVAERQIDDLGGLFATIRARLQRVSIWVFEADIAIEVQRGHASDAPDTPQREMPPRLSPSTAPALRIAKPPEPVRAPQAQPQGALIDEPEEDPPGPSGNTVTAEELEMLLDLFDGDRPTKRDDGGLR
jgi:hypothetical protein